MLTVTGKAPLSFTDNCFAASAFLAATTAAGIFCDALFTVRSIFCNAFPAVPFRSCPLILTATPLPLCSANVTLDPLMASRTFTGTCVSPAHTIFIFTLFIFVFCTSSFTLSCTLLFTAFQSTSGFCTGVLLSEELSSVGAGVVVGAGVPAGSGVPLGTGVSVGSGVALGAGVSAGSGVALGAGLSVGSGSTSPVLYRYISSHAPQASADAFTRIPSTISVSSFVIVISFISGLLQFCQPFISAATVCSCPL